MAYLADEKATEEKLKARIDQILVLSVTPPEGWPFADHTEWSDVRTLIDRVFVYLRALNSCSLEGLPKAYIDSIYGLVDQLFAPLNQMSSAIQTASAPNMITHLQQCRNTLSQVMNVNWVTQINTAILAMGSDSNKFTDVLGKVEDSTKKCGKETATSEATRTEIKEWLKGAQQEEKTALSKYDEEIKTRKEKLEEMETLYRNILAKVGTHAHAVRFEAEADIRGGESICWLACAGVLTCFLFYYFWGMEGDVTALLKAGVRDLWPLLAIKGGIISLASIILLACFRNFSACRHNQVVNKHRQNALSTYDFFLKSSEDDPEVKKAVAIEVMKAVFTADHSGYLKAANETNLSANVFEGLKK